MDRPPTLIADWLDPEPVKDEPKVESPEKVPQIDYEHLSRDQQEAYRADRQWFTLQYECPECDAVWSGEWSCAVDDDCPECQHTCEPSTYSEVEIVGYEAEGVDDD